MLCTLPQSPLRACSIDILLCCVHLSLSCSGVSFCCPAPSPALPPRTTCAPSCADAFTPLPSSSVPSLCDRSGAESSLATTFLRGLHAWQGGGGRGPGGDGGMESGASMESEGGGQARLASKTMPWAAAPRRGARPAPHVARQRAVLQHEAGVLGALPRLSPAHAARLGVVAGVGQVHHTVPRLQGLGQLVRLRASAGRARVRAHVGEQLLQRQRGSSPRQAHTLPHSRASSSLGGHTRS